VLAFAFSGLHNGSRQVKTKKNLSWAGH